MEASPLSSCFLTIGVLLGLSATASRFREFASSDFCDEKWVCGHMIMDIHNLHNLKMIESELSESPVPVKISLDLSQLRAR